MAGTDLRKMGDAWLSPVPVRLISRSPLLGPWISLRMGCVPRCEHYAHHVLYAPTVNADQWFGARRPWLARHLGGAISYLLSRLQSREAWTQRLEGERRDRARRSVDRRLDAYADFVTNARRFRNAIQTRAACGGVLRTLGQIEGVLHKLDRDADGQSWDKLNEDIERAIGSGYPLPVEQPIPAASRSAGQRSYPVCFASLAAR
jgi:hypothetical protein